MMKKLICRCLALVLMLPLILVGCTQPPTPNDPETLEMFVWDQGYGSKWVDDISALFVEQDWVKEKYPNLSVDIKTNNAASYVNDRLLNPQSNTIDLFFANNLFSIYPRTYNGKPYIADLSDVYNGKVPGEDILYKNKLFPTAEFTSRYTAPDGTVTYKGAHWAGGFDGIMYNKDHLDALGLSVPRTTDEFVDLCATVKARNAATPYGHTHSIIHTASGAGHYWRYLFPVWWGQFEGYNEYDNFWNGIFDNEVGNKEIFTQLGRLESLKVFESLISGKNGYVTPSSAEYTFQQTQNRFLSGEGLFYVTGGWFYNEMYDVIQGFKSQGIDFEFNFMRTPVLSSIVTLTPSVSTEATRLGIDTDELLGRIIDAIDSGESEYLNIDEDDFAKIKDARSISYSEMPRQSAVVPEDATAKEAAKDFLRFMATDIALNQYVRSTRGGQLPFNYEVKSKDKALYDSLPLMQRTKIDIYNSNEVPLTILPTEVQYPLSMYGGMLSISTIKPLNFESYFLSPSHKSAETIYNDEIAYWTAERWETVRINSNI